MSLLAHTETVGSIAVLRLVKDELMIQRLRAVGYV